MINAKLGRLHGQTVFLSASIPDRNRAEEYNRIPDAPFQVEQAVISLARAVFSEGGRLVFGGHPSISPLVAMVAGEYREPNVAESDTERPRSQVVIYQSMVFREVIPDDTDLMVRLGLAEEHWTETAEGEFFNRERGAASLQCPQSLILMRQAMIRDTDPIAMVCIGGMEGVREEAALFTERYDGRHRERRPIFALARTGGAASLLVDSFGTSIRQIDLEIERDIFERPSGEIGGMARFDTPKEDGIAVQPYPLIMQTIIDRIARRDDRPSAHE
jgi:hypothetical protein